MAALLSSAMSAVSKGTSKHNERDGKVNFHASLMEGEIVRWTD